MSEKNDGELSGKNSLAFPMLIAITALILSLTFGIVNYRQNNLSNLESSLRDTRDQLQLAKNDITDIRMGTIQQLVDAEFAVKDQVRLQDENAALTEKLRESSIRMGELEGQIKRMDHQLSRQSVALKAARKKAKAKVVAVKKSRSKKTTVASAQAAKKRGLLPTTDAMAASVDLHVYSKAMNASSQRSIIGAIQAKGFKPQSPKLLASMSLSNSTTVFYYDDSYKSVARTLVQILKSQRSKDVVLRKGVSPYPKNKIIIHLIGL